MGKKTDPKPRASKSRTRPPNPAALAAPRRGVVKPGAQGDRLDLARRARAELRRHGKLVKDAENIARRLPGALARLDNELVRNLYALARRFGYAVDESAAATERGAAFNAITRERDELRARIELLETELSAHIELVEAAITNEDTRARELAAARDRAIERGNKFVDATIDQAPAHHGV